MAQTIEVIVNADAGSVLDDEPAPSPRNTRKTRELAESFSDKIDKIA